MIRWQKQPINFCFCFRNERQVLQGRYPSYPNGHRSGTGGTVLNGTRELYSLLFFRAGGVAVAVLTERGCGEPRHFTVATEKKKMEERERIRGMRGEASVGYCETPVVERLLAPDSQPLVSSFRTAW